MRLFDFGLAKELKQRDLVQPPDGYRATGVTGSRRYMAPEVVKSQPYGFSADVYSFGILLWEIMALKTPFRGFNQQEHETKVAKGGLRPYLPRSWTAAMRTLVRACWAENSSKRWDMLRTCQALQAQLSQAKHTIGQDDGDWNISTRSCYLSSRQLSI